MLLWKTALCGWGSLIHTTMVTRDDVYREMKKFHDSRNMQYDGDPSWKADFGLRMHYDGPIYGLSSMFFPKEGLLVDVAGHYEGSVSIVFNGVDTVCSVEVSCKSFEELGDRCYEIFKAYVKTMDENRGRLDAALRLTAESLSNS